MAGLSFFSGKRSDAVNQSKSPTRNHNASSDYHPAPSTPEGSTSTIPVAVPVMYIPPGGVVTPAPPHQQQQSQSPRYQKQQQQQQLQLEEYGPSPPSRQQAALPATVTTAEVDHNLRLFHTATFAGRTLPHKMFIILSIVTGLTGINNIVAHLLALLLYGQYENSMEVLLRWYTIALCLFVVMIETNQTTPLVKQSYVFQHFATRGVYYNFLGVLGLVEYDIGNQNNYRYRQYGFFGTNSGSGTSRFTITLPTAEGAGELYIWMTSWVMFLIGLVYIILGTFCLHKKYHQIRRDYEQRCADAAASSSSGDKYHHHHHRSAIVLD